jgi:antitoxin YefM
MQRPHLDQDIRPLSEFRARVTSFVQKVRRTHRPVVITHRGKSAAVLLGVADYESILDQLELIQDVRDAEQQLAQGRAVEHKTAKTKILSRLKK